MDHVPDSRGMSDDAPEEAEAASPAEAESDADAAQGAAIDPDPEAATDEAPPVEVDPMEEPVSEGVEVLDVPEEPPLAEVEEDEREAFGEVRAEPEPVLEAPTGDVEAESIAPPDELSAPEPEMEGPGEDGAEVVDLMGRAEEAPEDQIPVEVPEEEALEEPATEPEPVVAEPAAAEAAEEPAAEPKVAEAVGEEAPPGRRDPFRGPGDWYVVHTYAGYENKVKANLESRIHSMQMEDKIFDVHIPMEDVMEIKGGKKQVVQRKVFPGYLLVKMIYDNDSWYVVRNTPGVTGFVSSGTGTKPTPLSRREVEKILTVKEEEVKPTFRLEFEEGDTVRIISGPFADFNGTISEINVDQSKLKVLVNIFDRETPVELGFDQVAKV